MKDCLAVGACERIRLAQVKDQWRVIVSVLINLD
jgi:hypothetical protein